MESNIPVVGGEEPNHDVPQTADHHAEVANGKTSANLAEAHHDGSPDEPTHDAGAQPEVAARTEHAPQVETHEQAEASASGETTSGVQAQTGSTEGEIVPASSD